MSGKSFALRKPFIQRLVCCSGLNAISWLHSWLPTLLEFMKGWLKSLWNHYHTWKGKWQYVSYLCQDQFFFNFSKYLCFQVNADKSCMWLALNLSSMEYCIFFLPLRIHCIYTELIKFCIKKIIPSWSLKWVGSGGKHVKNKLNFI